MIVRALILAAGLLASGCARTTQEPRPVNPAEPRDAARTPVTVEFRRASVTPVEGYREFAAPGGRTVYVDPEPFLTHADVAAARLFGDGKEQFIEIEFKREGAQTLAEVTRAQIGKLIAIFANDRLISAPLVQTAIASGRAYISGNFTPQEAQDIVDSLSK